ncbi:MAG: hypothetical protein GY930_05225 [bacterium]|nr:hypothetical protein [bacterium]
MKSQPHPNRSHKAGFAASELVVVVLVLAILMGVVKMRSGNLLNQTKITKITQTVAKLSSACALFHSDTAHYALHKQDGDKQLTLSELPGWNGPYLEDSDLSGGNPLGEFSMDSSHTGFGLATGWDLDSDGVEEVFGPCNVAVLTGIDKQTAVKLDHYYDADPLEGWKGAGHFQYIPASKSGLIFLYK